MSQLPPYDAPFNPVPQVTPLTYRDGVTLLKKLDDLKKYINRTLVPFVNDNFEELAEAFETQANALILAVNTAIAEVIESSVTIQDPVVAAMLANPASATRIALELILSDYYTETAANAQFETKTDATTKFNARYTKTEVDALLETLEDVINDTVNPAIAGLDARLDAYDALTTGTGRLAEVKLDERYVNEFLNPVAVTIGSSNAEASRSYVADMCARNGWINKNFAIGGGGFNQPGALSYFNQATAAIADGSIIKANVKFVFIIDLSNDTRGKSSVFSAANTVFTMLESAFPNARIIVVPEVLTHAAPNTSDREVLRWVSRHYNEVRNASQAFTRIEVINSTWLWFWDNVDWILGDGFNVHLTAAGYDRLAWYIEQYVNLGINHVNDLPDTTGAVAGGITGEVHSRRLSGIAYSYGSFTLSATTTTLAVQRVQQGFYPLNRQPVMISNGDGSVTRAIELAVDGYLNIQTSTPAGTYYWESAYGVI